MKKRILSLILALSMVLSVLPLGAFAEGSTGGELVMKGGYPDCSNGTTGNGWSYDSSTQTLILKGKNREFDFSLANPQDTTNKTPADSAVKCAIESGAKITGGTFEGSVKNHWYITDGIFYGTVTNLREWFDGYLDTGMIQGGTFNRNVENNTNAVIENGTFNETVTNNAGYIYDGTFKGDVINNNRGDIKGGTFNKKVTNNAGGEISGGTFAGSVENKWNIYGGVFNGKTGLDGVTGVHSITWDAASSKANPKAEIKEVNGVAANWAPYVYAGTTVTITASTKIYSLNGKRISTDYNSSYPNKNDKKTVTFTMPNENVVLSTGELVIGSDGYPVGSNGGQDFCSGNNWEYSNYKGTLHLSAGTFDLSTTEPVKCKIQSYATINGGTFNGTVKISAATITKGIFNGTVYNGDAIISGGTFAAGLSDNYGTVTGGAFNGNTALTDARHVTVTNGSVLKVNGVDPRNADGTPGTAWNLYSYKGTPMTITASTDIYSLNDQPIGAGNCNSSYGSDKTTVTFTMPDEDVVLNGAITCTDLVMEKGWPKASNEGKISCSGTGWEYIKKSSGSTNTGTLYLMSGSEPFDFNFADPATKITRTDAAVKCAIESYGTISGGIFDGTVTNNAGGEISDGTFKGDVENSGYIEKGTFNGEVTNNTSGTIFGGTFRGQVDNNGKITGGIFAAGLSKNNGSKILGGIFNGNANLTGAYHVTVTDGSVSQVNGEGPLNADGTPGTAWDLYSYKGTTVTITADTEIFSLNGKSIDESSYPDTTDKKTVTFTMPGEPVVLNGAITCTDLVMKKGYPEDSNGGTTPCEGTGWTYSKKDASNPKGKLTLTDGTYDFSYTYPQNSNGAGAEPVACAVETQLRVKITGGTFEGEVINNDLGVISGGTFHEKVSNSNGMITGGTFKSSVTSKGYGRIFGGVFNGNATLTNVTGLHSITVASGAKIKEVNGMSADWDPYVVVTENATTNEVIITADTEIFSLNGKSIGDGNCKSSYDGSDYKTVKFTMPGEPVVLNGAITCTDLVMEKGWPQASKDGQISCSGTGWEYIKKSSGSTNTGTLYLMSGSEPFDFNFADPATKITRTDAAVKCAIESYGTISGGIFDGTVTNNAGGEISDGTFKGDVENSGYIEKGTFNGEVTNNTSGTIFGGTFRGQVDNNGKITGGIFAAGLSTTPGTVTGGIFNGNMGLTGAHQVTVTNGSVSTVNDEGPRNADGTWDLYSYKDTTMTIIASTEIFSLNGKSIGDGNCNSSYGVDKKTVTFTMPDDDVVLNRAITSTDLVMVNGYPKDSSGGKTPCKGDGWEYIPNDPTNGNMLLLTGSNQTGGLFDFSTIGDGSAVECNVFVGKPTAITGGEFNGKVFNNSGILGGTFHGEVDNTTMGRIENGTFKNSVENNGIIENGTFHDEVKNNGTINDGTFAGSVSNNGGTVNGGIFNGNTGLDEVTGLHSITWDAASSNAKIEKVNGVSADWKPYVVTSNATTKEVTITADTEIFSLNGQPIAESSYGVDKKTVTFTMPDDDVVLNGELITKPEPEPEPKPEPEPTTYTVTVIGGTIDGKTSVSAKENDTLTVVLDQNDIPDGMTFDLWSISSSKLSGDINVDYRAEAMTFQMPAEDVTIRAQYRSAEIIEDAAPSPLATAATIAVGGAAAGIVVWQGVSLGVDLYLTSALPQGVPVPTDRRALALLLWETAGKPEVALPTLYGDIPAEEIELQKATRWAVQNGLMDAADKKDASFFDPDHYVTKMDVFGAWLRLKKLLGTT